MPLLDHFRPPLFPERHWESFHAVWATSIMGHLNRVVLPEGYFAEAQVHVGSRVEIDVATFDKNSGTLPGDSGGVAVQTWAPPTLVAPAIFPDEIEVQVYETVGGNTLVGAIELISPGNKDRPEARRAFAAKCAGYLQMGIGLVILDVVTSLQSNLHDELIDVLRLGNEFAFPGSAPLYTASYRPVRSDAGGDQIEIWPTALSLGQPLPTVPLPLRRGPMVPLDLDATYNEARQKSRL